MRNRFSNRTWMILGAVITVIMGGSLLVAGGIFFYFFAPTPTPPSATQPATENAAAMTVPLIRTRPPAGTAERQPTPTFLPVPDGSGTTSEDIQLPSTNNEDFVESPQQSVVNYYRDITRGDYEATWSQLSDAFKEKFNCCAPDYDYGGYLDWWNTVDRVDFGEVRLVEQSGDTAVVFAELIYTMEEGGSFQDSEPYIDLQYDETQGRWLFEDKRSEPR